MNMLMMILLMVATIIQAGLTTMIIGDTQNPASGVISTSYPILSHFNFNHANSMNSLIDQCNDIIFNPNQHQQTSMTDAHIMCAALMDYMLTSDATSNGASAQVASFAYKNLNSDARDASIPPRKNMDKFIASMEAYLAANGGQWLKEENCSVAEAYDTSREIRQHSHGAAIPECGIVAISDELNSNEWHNMDDAPNTTVNSGTKVTLTSSNNLLAPCAGTYLADDRLATEPLMSCLYDLAVQSYEQRKLLVLKVSLIAIKEVDSVVKYFHDRRQDETVRFVADQWAKEIGIEGGNKVIMALMKALFAKDMPEPHGAALC